MITLTPSAINKIKKSLERRGKGIGIKLGVKTTGCSGLAYVLEYADDYVVDESILNFPHGDIAVFVDRKSYVYLENVTVDFVRNGLNEGFEFKNPNERDRCGCGESFRV